MGSGVVKRKHVPLKLAASIAILACAFFSAELFVMFWASTADAKMPEADCIARPMWMDELAKLDGTVQKTVRPYHESLTEPQQAVYEKIEAAFRSYSPCCTVDSSSFSDVQTAFDAVGFDNPDIFWVDNYIFIPVISDSPTGVFFPLYFDGSYAETKEKHDRYMQEIEEIAQEIQRKRKNCPWEEDRVKDAIKEICTRLDFGSNENDQTICAFFGEGNGETVCSGYAKCLCLLSSALGSECYFVCGSTDGEPMRTHAWNMLRIDGMVCYADATWSDEGERANPIYLTFNGYAFGKSHYPDALFRKSDIYAAGEAQSEEWHIAELEQLATTQPSSNPAAE